MKALIVAAAFAALSAPAFAQDDDIVLKDGPGKDTVQNACGACHSLSYIEMNSPFLDQPKWDATVKKMINAFGAVVEPDEAKTIVEYLTKNYGG